MKIVIVGYGTMGHLLLSRIEEKEDLQCVGLIASSYYREIAELPQHPEVIIDVSHPDNFVKIERAMQTQRIPLVLATTGYSEAQKQKIEGWAKSVPVVMTSNFSIGMTIVNKMLKCCQKEIAQYFDCDILEIHHEQKKDKPSGSALMLKKTLQGISTDRYGYQKPISVTSLRHRQIAGEHTVILCGDHEQITITHTADSREIFIRGILEAVEAIPMLSAGLYSMEDLLRQRLGLRR